MKKNPWLRIPALLLALVMTLGVMSVAVAEEEKSIIVGYVYDQYTTPLNMDSQSAVSLANLYDCLYTYDHDMKAVPELAESYELNEDGTVYTFKIRQGVKFHDGSELKADDVAWSLNYIYANSSAGKTLLLNFGEAVALDDYTVQITLVAPFGGFLNCLCSRAGYIMSHQHWMDCGEDVSAYEADPIGTGPYKFADRTVGESLKLTANEDYFKGVPAIKNVELRYISDANTQIIALEAGDIQVMITPSVSSCLYMDPTNLSWLYGNSSSRVLMRFLPNNDKTDLNLRKAIQCLVNKEDILIATNDGYGTIADIAVPYGYTGRPDTYTVVERNLDKAKEYLAQSSYDGGKLSLIVSSGTSNETAANILQAQCYELGINVEVNAVDSATFQSLSAAGSFDICCQNTLSSIMDCDLLRSIYGRGNTNQNYGDELAQMLDDARLISDPEARKAKYGEVVEILTNDAIEVTFFYDIVTIAFNNSVQNVWVHPLKMFDISEWSLK